MADAMKPAKGWNETIQSDDFKALSASPPAREEAPELALEDAKLFGVGFIVDGQRVSPDRVTVCRGEEAPAEGAVGRLLYEAFWKRNGGNEPAWCDQSSAIRNMWDAIADDAQALRNRTSEPEAGEVEMTSASEVLSLMTRDPVIVAMKKNGLSDSQLIALGYALVADRKSHPAPATAAKLLVAVEAGAAAEDELDRVAEEDVTYEPLMTRDALCVVRQALAALNEQPQ